MTKAIDISGQTFGKLTVDFRIGSDKEGKALWSCTCECGKSDVKVRGKDLRTGNTKTCGCSWKDAAQTKVIDLSGRIFDRLTVTRRKGSNKEGKAIWLCDCSCGTKDVEVVGRQLIAGKTRSCGCLYKESRTVSKNKKHGYFGTRIYRIWSGMMTRCTNPNHEHYNDYGGRGIQVCDQWKTFEGFIKDVGLPPSDDHTLDRYPDPNGNYEPNNFRWATSTEQGRNRKNTIMLTYKNETKSLIEWAEFFDIKYSTAKRRYYKGLCVEEILGIDKKDGGIAC